MFSDGWPFTPEETAYLGLILGAFLAFVFSLLRLSWLHRHGR